MRCQSLEPLTASTQQLAAGIGQRCTLFSASGGPGSISALQVAILAGSAGNFAGVQQDCKISFTVDGRTDVNDCGTFFLIHGEPTPPFATSDAVTLYQFTKNQNFGALRRLFIPWQSSCLIELINQSADCAGAIFSEVYWNDGTPPLCLTGTRKKVWHMASVPITAIGQYAALDLCSITGRGQIESVQMLMFQAPMTVANPTWLEGNMEWRIDGQPVEFATGTEDFFGGQYYWGQNHNATDSWGVVKCGPFGNGNGTGPHFAVTAYRIFSKEPMIFDTSARLTWHNGQVNQGSSPPGTTSASAIVTYYLDA